MNTIYSDQQLKEYIQFALDGNITHEELAAGRLVLPVYD